MNIFTEKRNRELALYPSVSSPQRKRGFTLIEMLIAVFIFSLSLAALMSITSRGLRVANQAQKQVIADYLAIEAIEVVRNIRDSALPTSNNAITWQDILNQNGCFNQIGINSSCRFILQNTGLILDPCTTCIVYYSEDDYAYRHLDAPSGSYRDSGFTRKIKFTSVPDNNREIIVHVTVAWDKGQVDYTEDLYLWF